MLHSTWTNSRDIRIHARVADTLAPDTAPTVILVHGAGVSSRYMVPTAERLAAFCRVYVPDLPGFGKSGKPRHVLTVDELADALVAWMNAAGVRRAALLGNSFGCQIIAAFALRHPQRITQAVLQGPTVDPAARTLRQQFWRWLQNSRNEAASQALIIARDYRDCGVRRLVRTFRYAIDDRIEDKLPSMHLPTLVVRGSRDPIVPQAWAEEVTRRLPHGRLVIIPGFGHTLNYAAPDELVRVVHPFLCEHRERAVG